MDKLSAAEAYRTGRFDLDGEHPALMKLAIAAVLVARTVWNAQPYLSGWWPLQLETALRLPNAIAGTGLVVLLFLVGRTFFGGATGLVAAGLWAFEPHAVAASRIAKEDTFALGFLLLAVWLYECGKRRHPTAAAVAQRCFLGAGAAFGLMLASKYVPYFVGIHAIYLRFADRAPGANRPDTDRYLTAMALAFAVANFPWLLGGTWRTVLAFFAAPLSHTGYVFQGIVWDNRLAISPAGIPIWFYAADLVTKTPMPVLAAMGLGLFALTWEARHRRDPQDSERALFVRRGAMFVGLTAILTFVPYSLVATKFLRYLLPTRAVLILMAAFGLTRLAQWHTHTGTVRQRLATTLCLATIAASALACWSVHPWPALFRNAAGHALAPGVLWFAPDELYDAGLREATAAVAACAPAGARLLTDAPHAVSHYASRQARTDLLVLPLSGSHPAPGDWIFVQDGRRYLESDALIAQARGRPAAATVTLGPFTAVSVHRW